MSGGFASAAPGDAPDSPPVPERRRSWRLLRFVPLAFGAASLVAGLATGLIRIGVVLPVGTASADLHAALMICGFLGTLISLERAVGLGVTWAYAAPALSAAGAMVLLAGMPDAAALAFLAASVALTAASVAVVRRLPALFTVVLAIAPVCWGAGTLLWIAGRSMAEVAGWWLGFLVLTIAAERLELSRLRAPPRRSQLVFAGAVALLVVGAAREEFAAEAAWFTGAGLLAATAWLWKHDIAIRTVRQHGQTRFSAVCMLAGYVWLGVAGALLLVVPPGAAAFSFDAAVHAVTIGFVLSMIFGHAPIILPAVTGIRLGYGAAAYVPLVLLHLSVLMRIAADLLEWVDLRAAGGMLTAAAVVAYAATLAVLSARRRGLLSRAERS